jgi:Glycosyl transferases group 1
LIDVLIVSLGSTGGLRAADEELRDSLRRAGASVELVRAEPPGEVRTLMLTDLRWPLAARRAVSAALARTPARALIYSSTTAALLWSRPGAIRFDAPAAANRPGRHGLWQRPLERRRLAQSPLLLPWSEGGLAELTGSGAGSGAGDSGSPGAKPSMAAMNSYALVSPVPVEPSGRAQERPEERDIAAIAYAANPLKKGLDRVFAAWARVRQSGEELVVAGAEARELAAAGLASTGEGVRVTGLLAPEEYRALLRRARVFVCAPRREDYGLAQLEALADGCQLVTSPAPGPYAALALARQLDARLVGEDLGIALRAALDDPAPDYSGRALAALEPFRREAVDRSVADELLPRLLGED